MKMKKKELPKLVRDKIPDLIATSGKKCSYRVANSEEYLEFLVEKMKEEAEEFMHDPTVEEAADMYEVFREMLLYAELSMRDVEFRAYAKHTQAGKYENRIILERVEENKIE